METIKDIDEKGRKVAIREQIIALVHKEVVPAIGCTEPMAVALCTAKAKEQLGCRPEKIVALLSASCVVASIGSNCGITYLMGGDYERICYAVKNMIANLTGMICDGAKPSCSLKITSGVSTAMLSALLAMEGKCVSQDEGIVDNDVDKSIHNLTSIGAEAMCKTDDMVLSIMTSKKH